MSAAGVSSARVTPSFAPTREQLFLVRAAAMIWPEAPVAAVEPLPSDTARQGGTASAVPVTNEQLDHLLALATAYHEARPAAVMLSGRLIELAPSRNQDACVERHDLMQYPGEPSDLGPADLARLVTTATALVARQAGAGQPFAIALDGLLLGSNETRRVHLMLGKPETDFIVGTGVARADNTAVLHASADAARLSSFVQGALTRAGVHAERWRVVVSGVDGRVTVSVVYPEPGGQLPELVDFGARNTVD